MTGRTLSRWMRVYANGYDLSGRGGRQVGPLLWGCDETDLTAEQVDAVKGSLPGIQAISAGTYNGVLSSTTDSGTEISTLQTVNTPLDIMIPVGIRANPKIGDVVFVMKSTNPNFRILENNGAMTISADWGMWDANDLVVPPPWGILLHPNTAETAVNSSTTDTIDIGAGGGGVSYMAYQIFSGDVAGTIKVQNADQNLDGSFGDVQGLTATIAIPSAGIVAATATTIKQYLRWQITISSGTSLTFALAIHYLNA